MKVRYEFKTKQEAVDYLMLRGWIVESQGEGFVQMSNIECRHGNRVLRHGPRNVWMIFAS